MFRPIVESKFLNNIKKHDYNCNSKPNLVHTRKRVASLCKEWNLQGKKNGRKMVDYTFND